MTRMEMEHPYPLTPLPPYQLQYPKQPPLTLSSLLAAVQQVYIHMLCMPDQDTRAVPAGT